MSRHSKGTAPAQAREAPELTAPDANEAESQPTPAGPRQMRQDGLQIDGFGLPVNGIARAKVLAELGEKDPVGRKSPAAWGDEKAALALEVTEKLYG